MSDCSKVMDVSDLCLICAFPLSVDLEILKGEGCGVFVGCGFVWV